MLIVRRSFRAQTHRQTERTGKTIFHFIIIGKQSDRLSWSIKIHSKQTSIQEFAWSKRIQD